MATAATALRACRLCPPVWAKSNSVAPYPPTNVWSSAVRFLRVDRGYAIREKDEATGYLMFDVVDGQRTNRGSLELVPTTEAGRPATRMIFSLPDLPHHWEQMLLDKLTAKLRDDHGEPLPAPPPAKKPTPEDDKKAKPGTNEFPKAPTSDLPRAKQE